VSQIKPKGGINARLHPHDVSRNQWIAMQNVDMTHDEHFTQIKGSTKFHGTSMGTIAASAIMPCYNNELDTADILVAVEDKIYKKNLGANEMEELFSGLPADEIMFSLNEGNKQYIPHPTSGYYEYDGISKIIKISDDKFRDIIMSKETNRAFATSAVIPNAYNWTDDLVTMGGVPITWNPINTDTVPTTDGDSIEKIMFMRGRLVFFMTHSIWIEYVNGGPENWRYEKIPTTVGCIAPKSVRMVKDEIWFLGNSPESGVGLYAFNGSNVKLLSYDVESIFKRINPNRMTDACAEYFDNLYRLSFALDASITNNTTLHVDAINYNSETELPCFYGPHTYGFRASSNLNFKRFAGQMIFSQQRADGSWVFKVDDVMTQYATSAQTPGDLIAGVLISPIYCEEDGKDGKYDETWMKRYEKIYSMYPPAGNWYSTIEILDNLKNQTYTSWNQFMDGDNYKLESFFLGMDPLDLSELAVKPKLQDMLSNSFQLKISNFSVNTKLWWDSLTYDFRPVRRIRDTQRIYI
jgi:hypothetical protein